MTRVALLTLLTLAWGSARADRLHLTSGGVLEIGSWTLEGDQIVYSGPAGRVGLPRTVIAWIETTPGPPAPAPSMPAVPSAAPAAQPGPPPDETAQRDSAAAAALGAREFEKAARLYEALWRESRPDSGPGPAVGYAMSQMALGRDDLALNALQDGLTWNPGQPVLLELLGDLRNREERVEQALSAWNEAFAAAPSDRVREKILKAERELHASRNYDYTSANHFNLRFDGAQDPDLAREVSEHLEEQYWVLADALDHAPTQPITVVLYPTQAFRDVTQSPEWVGGVYDGKIRVPLGGLRHLNSAAGAVLTHELTHAILHSKTHGQCPRWLHEGLAQRFEGRTLRRAEMLDVARRVRTADPAAWERSGFSYPAALSLVQYLESRGGLHRLVDVLEQLGGARSIDEALGAVYGKNYAELCKDWALSLARFNS